MEDSLPGTDTKLEKEAAAEDTKDPITKETSAGNNTIDTPAPQSTKSVILERLILCTALFFPLFLATLDTTIVATALPRKTPLPLPICVGILMMRHRVLVRPTE
jgi:hypothetical protein